MAIVMIQVDSEKSEIMATIEGKKIKDISSICDNFNK